MAIDKNFSRFGSAVKRGAIVALVSSLGLIASCGGGGTQGPSPTGPGENMQLLPGSGSLYANVPQTFTIAGGRPPYFVTSNEQTVIPLNLTTSSNTFTVVPNQPGVVDPQDDPNIVPSRQVILTLRDSNTTQLPFTYNVLQNFLTGYNLIIETTATCDTGGGPTTPGAAAPAVEACAGSDSRIRLVPISAGLRFANKQLRFCANFGPFDFILDSTGITGQCVTQTADSTGEVTARIRVRPGVPTQYAQFRMTDVATGQYRDVNFVVVNSNGNQSALSTVPTTISLTGPNANSCGTGFTNIVVLGGTPPYSAQTTAPTSINITPSSIARSGDAFTIQVFNPNICLSNAQVVITDAVGASASVSVSTTAGTAPAVLPLTVAPTTLCVPDGGSGVISISGGQANKVINSSNPGLAQATPTTGTNNFTPQINALGAGGAAGTTVTFSITDGASTATVNVLRKTTCP